MNISNQALQSLKLYISPIAIYTTFQHQKNKHPYNLDQGPGPNLRN